MDFQRQCCARLQQMPNRHLLQFLGDRARPGYLLDVHIPALFSGIASFDYNHPRGVSVKASVNVKGFVTARGDRVKLDHEVLCMGAPEQWLIDLDSEIRSTMHSLWHANIVESSPNSGAITITIVSITSAIVLAISISI